MGLMRVTPPGTFVRTAKGTRIAQHLVPYQDIGTTARTPSRPREGRMIETPNGRFCWGELLTTDPAAAADFYRAVIGWGTREWEGSETPYAVWMNNDTPVGGLMQLPAELTATGAPPHWLVYISTPDAEACGMNARSLGGTQLNMLELPDVGRMAIIADPQGAVFSAYQPSDMTPGHDGPAAVGEFSWHELATTD